MKARLVLIAVAALAVLGCKVDSSGSSNSKKEFYSYDFTENGCPTGAHSSNSVAGICKALQDHTLNNHCAYGLRAEMFNQHNCVAVLGNKLSAQPSVNAVDIYVAEFTYEIRGDFCTTGTQTFASREELCSGLLDEVRNSSCGLPQRRELFAKKRCGQ